MERMRVLVLLGGCIFFFVLSSCDGRNPADIADADVRPSVTVEATPGVWVSSTQMSGILARLARSVALALGESEILREQVHAAIARSAFPEGKLEFKALLQDPEIRLAQEIALAEGASVAAVLATMDSVIDLEMYLPVESHRNTWNGGTDLLVASALHQPGPIFGFDLDGTPVPLASERPPNRPALVIVPAETNFDAARAATPQTAFAASAASSYRLLRMVESYQPNLHEPWTSGDPEIAAHVFARDTGSVQGAGAWVRCSGDGIDPSLSSYYFGLFQTSCGWARSAEG